MKNKKIEEKCENFVETIDKLYKHIEYPSMPFAIDDIVYYIEKASERGGLPGYKIIKCICYGYYNFGSGWKIKLRTNRHKFKFSETVFNTKAETKHRIKDINGFVVEVFKSIILEII